MVGSAISMASAISTSSSAMSFHSRHRHGGKRGKSRLVATSNLYQKAIDSESHLSAEKYSSIEVRSMGTRAVDIQFGNNSGSNNRREFEDDILPEHAADAVSMMAIYYLLIMSI